MSNLCFNTAYRAERGKEDERGLPFLLIPVISSVHFEQSEFVVPVSTHLEQYPWPE